MAKKWHSVVCTVPVHIKNVKSQLKRQSNCSKGMALESGFIRVVDTSELKAGKTKKVTNLSSCFSCIICTLHMMMRSSCCSRSFRLKRQLMLRLKICPCRNATYVYQFSSTRTLRTQLQGWRQKQAFRNQRLRLCNDIHR